MQFKLSLKSMLPPRDLGWNRVRSTCALPDCHNNLLMRAVPGARLGIYVGETWYCSPDCFAADSRRVLSTLTSATIVEMPRNPRLSLGLALLSRGFITEDQLRFATSRHLRHGESLESALLEQGVVTEKQLAAGRSAQWGVPVLGQEPLDHSVEIDLPPSLLQACSAAPVHYSAKARRLVLGFVHRVEHGLLQSVERISGLRPEPCFITPMEFAQQMNRLSTAPGYEEIVEENPGSPGQMARTLGGFAVELSATEASFARCKASVWARIVGKRGTVDVIFALKASAAASPKRYSTAIPEVTPALG